MQNKFTLLILPLIISGCVNLAPEYKKPDNIIPKEIVNIGIEDNVIVPDDLFWKNYINNEKLKKVVDLGLLNNKDLKIAINNIEIARAKYGIEKSNRLPQIDINYNGQIGKTESNELDSASLNANISSYELDIFSRVKNLSESALQDYLNTTEIRNYNEILIRNEIIKSYYDIAYYKEAFNISKKSEMNNYKNLDIIQKRLDNGLSTEKDLSDAKSSYYKSKSDSLMYKTNVDKSINYLNYLIGMKLDDSLLPNGTKELNKSIKNLDKNFNSEILLNRPDILAAEHVLKSKNANIGAARAAFFPKISLTASNGIASNDLSALFNNNFNTWSFIPNISIPIFNAGKNRSNLEISIAEQKNALVSYEKTLQKAFYDVLDQLSIKANMESRLNSYNEVLKSSSLSYDLSMKSYNLGAKSYLEVLIAERALYSYQIQNLELEKENFYSQVDIYKVLGY